MSAYWLEPVCPECGSDLPGLGECPICRVEAVPLLVTEDASPTCRCGAILKPLEHACWQCRSAALQQSLAAPQLDWLEAQ